MKKVRPWLIGFAIGIGAGGVVLGAFFLPPQREPYKARPVFVVVLGCKPLDSKTPSLDMVRRVERGVEVFLSEGERARLVLTGGRTLGPVSEARMMADIAGELGVPRSRLLLEERSVSTRENARFTMRLLRRARPAVLVLVSRPDHRARAVDEFKRVAFPIPVRFIGSRIAKEEIVADFERYLAVHDSPDVRERLTLARALKG